MFQGIEMGSMEGVKPRAPRRAGVGAAGKVGWRGASAPSARRTRGSAARTCWGSHVRTLVSVRRRRPTADQRRPLRSDLSVMPGHQLVQTGDLVVSNAAENIGQPGLRINAVQLGGLDQRIGAGGGFAPAFWPNKEVFFLPYPPVRTNEPECPIGEVFRCGRWRDGGASAVLVARVGKSAKDEAAGCCRDVSMGKVGWGG